APGFTRPGRAPPFSMTCDPIGPSRNTVVPGPKFWHLKNGVLRRLREILTGCCMLQPRSTQLTSDSSWAIVQASGCLGENPATLCVWMGPNSILFEATVEDAANT